MKKNGQITPLRYLLFKFVFLLLRVNDRLRGAGGTPLGVRFRGIFEILLPEG